MAIFDPPSGHQDTAATGLLYGTKKERQFRIFPLGAMYRKVASSRPVYYSILNSFGQRLQYIRIKFPLHKQSKNP